MKAIALISALCYLAPGRMSADEARPILLPTPKNVAWLDGKVRMSSKAAALACVIDATAGKNAVATGLSQLNERLRSLGVAALPTQRDADRGTVLWVGTRHELLSSAALLGDELVLPKEMCVPDGYILRCRKIGNRDVAICAGYDDRGCYYGLQTLIQLLSTERGTVSMPRVEITDWPTYRLRLVKIDSSATDPEGVARWANLMPRYKMNVMASQFRPTADTGSWRQPSQLFQKNTETIARTGRTADTLDPLVYFGPFGKGRGSLIDPQLIEDYVAACEARIAQGYKWIGFDFNDWGTYKSLSPEEQARFKDVGEVMTWLTMEVYNRIHPRHSDVGFVSVPVAGYYQGAAKPELISYCKAIPKDIMVITTGPVTRSKEISKQWLADWTSATGRKPFLWDNTIYSHLDQYRPLVNGYYNLNAYTVDFPADMPKLLEGPGIHLNGTARRWWEPGTLTFLDYMWNPEAYNPKTSLRNAQMLLWGKDAPDAADEVQRADGELYAYLFNARAKTDRGTLDEALASYSALEKSVKRLADVIADPSVARGLNEQCLKRAMVSIKRVFPDEQTK